MSKEDNNSGKSRTIPNSSTKTARGSTNIHSQKDQSTKDGFKPNYPDKESTSTKAKADEGKEEE